MLFTAINELPDRLLKNSHPKMNADHHKTVTSTGSTPVPRIARRASHVLDNYYIGPARDPGTLEIWAYTDRFSYAPNCSVRR